MLPMPTMRRPSMRKGLICRPLSRVSVCSRPPSSARDSGSMPRWRIRGCASGGSPVQRTAPKRRGSRNRRTCGPKLMSIWSCLPGGVPGATRRRLPDMPRCRIRWPSPQSSSRYLPRRRTARTWRPASLRTACGTRQRKRGSRTATAGMVRPSTCGAIPLRVTSTSGSSGMVRKATRWRQITLCEAQNIPTLPAAMPDQIRKLSALAAALLAMFLYAAGAAAQQPQDADEDDDEPPLVVAPAAKPPANLPRHELTGPMLYDFLLGEIAAQRGSPGFAAQTYLDLAKRTRDPRVAKRAGEVANFARMPDLTMESARLWHDTDPASTQALQTLVVLLVSAKRVEDTEPYIARLMATDKNAPGNVFMQLARLLAGSQDAPANLRVVTKLAGRYPSLPQAHFAMAQAANAASDEPLALAEIRRAAVLRPEWEIAAVYEAQLLRRRAPGEAAK